MTPLFIALLAALGAGCGGGSSTAASSETVGGAESHGASASLATEDSAAVRTRGLYLSDDEPESEAVRADAFMEIRLMQVYGDGTERPVAPGAVMRAGDAFYLRVLTREEARVYVMYVGPDQQPHMLLPEDGEDIVAAPGTETRVPRSGRAITLDDAVGMEQLYIVASRRSLDELADDTLAAVQAARQGHRPPPIDAQAATPVELVRAERSGRPERSGRVERPASSVANGAVVRTRGMSVVQQEPRTGGSAGGARIIASADDAGVAVILFPIDHQ